MMRQCPGEVLDRLFTRTINRYDAENLGKESQLLFERSGSTAPNVDHRGKTVCQSYV